MTRAPGRCDASRAAVTSLRGAFVRESSKPSRGRPPAWQQDGGPATRGVRCRATRPTTLKRNEADAPGRLGVRATAPPEVGQATSSTCCPRLQSRNLRQRSSVGVPEGFRDGTPARARWAGADRGAPPVVCIMCVERERGGPAVPPFAGSQVEGFYPIPAPPPVVLPGQMGLGIIPKASAPTHVVRG